MIASRQGIFAGMLAGCILAWGIFGCSSYDEPASPKAAAAPAPAPQSPAEPGRFPQINPGGGTWIPAWAGKDKDEPFDVKRYLESRAFPADNAAPLYLAALAEISPEMYSSEPSGDWPWTKDKMPKEVEDVCRGIDELSRNENLLAGSVAADQIESLLTKAQPALKKLDEAQRKPHCVFVNAMRYDSLLPNIQAARGFARLAIIQLYHARQKGNFDEAQQAVERTLRLSRDLRPRGGFVAQLVGTTIEGIALGGTRDFTLRQPGLDVKGCDRLLALLEEHQHTDIPAFEEGIRVEYLMLRHTIDALQNGRMSAKEFAQFVLGESTAQKITEMEQQLSKANWPAEVAACNAGFAAALALKAAPFDPAHPRQWQETTVPDLQARNVVVILKGAPGFDAVQGGLWRAKASLAGTECLIAVRRFQLAHNELPQELATAARETKLKAVPTDPFSGQPMLYKVVDDKPIVYSVGPDGKDDGGQADWDNAKWTGDMLFRIRE